MPVSLEEVLRVGSEVLSPSATRWQHWLRSA